MVVMKWWHCLCDSLKKDLCFYFKSNLQVHHLLNKFSVRMSLKSHFNIQKICLFFNFVDVLLNNFCRMLFCFVFMFFV